MAHLHEILAVEKGLELTAKKLTDETKKTLKKDNLFKGSVKSLVMASEDEQKWNTVESFKLETTVDENLGYTKEAIVDYWDSVLQKDKTNQLAKADIVTDDGVVIAKNVPVSFLLGLETKLNDYRKILDAIPTLPPGIRWEEDPQERPGVYVAKNDSIQFKTEKELEFKEASPATKEHPAQIAQVNVTKNVGTYTTINHCGMLSPFEKARRIRNHETMLRAVKKARQRANNQEIVIANIGKIVLDYIDGQI